MTAWVSVVTTDMEHSPEMATSPHGMSKNDNKAFIQDTYFPPNAH